MEFKCGWILLEKIMQAENSVKDPGAAANANHELLIIIILPITCPPLSLHIKR